MSMMQNLYLSLFSYALLPMKYPFTFFTDCLRAIFFSPSYNTT